MKIIELLEMLFTRSNDTNSGQKAKERLQLVLAHDRAAINPEVVELMRQEILEVVARYVDIDREEMEFGLENTQRITTLIANFPIRKVKRHSKETIEFVAKEREEKTKTEFTAKELEEKTKDDESTEL